MAMHGIIKTTVLLSLAFTATAFTEQYYRPTAKMRSRLQGQDQIHRNRQSNFRNISSLHTHIDTRSANESFENQRDLGNDDTIIYPDVGLNTSCIHGLCENVMGYPRERIKKLLSRSLFAANFLVDEKVEVNIVNRIKPQEELCETRSQTLYPEKAKNINKVEKVIVNVDGHKQGIAVETCLTTGECKFSKGFPEQYVSFCQQKYIHKKLMVLGDDDNFVFDSFEVPSCCVCTLKEK